MRSEVPEVISGDTVLPLKYDTIISMAVTGDSKISRPFMKTWMAQKIFFLPYMYAIMQYYKNSLILQAAMSLLLRSAALEFPPSAF